MVTPIPMIIRNALLDKLVKRACVSTVAQIFDELMPNMGSGLSLTL